MYYTLYLQLSAVFAVVQNDAHICAHSPYIDPYTQLHFTDIKGFPNMTDRGKMIWEGGLSNI